jgi:hypothetical protein
MSNWTYWGPVTMLTYQAMRWKLSGPEPTGPQTPYHHAFPHWPPATLLAMPERSCADSLGDSFLSFFYMYIYILFFIPWTTGFGLTSVVKQSENDLI